MLCIVATAVLLCAILVACAPSAPDPGKAKATATTSEWKKGDFQVLFQAGPGGESGKSFSYYEINHAPPGQQKRSLVKESAHTLEGLSCVTTGHPTNWIRIIPDPSGKALLIEEEIPNECGPCSNYLWVHLGDDDSVEGTYLRLPSKTIGPPGGIDYQYPKVASLEGRVVKYDYTQGETVTQHMDQIEKSDSPTPP
jgi:hypothetical protein